MKKINKLLDSYHFHDASEFVKRLPDINDILVSIAFNYPSFNKQLSRYLIYSIGNLLPILDTSQILVIVSALQNTLIGRYKRKDCPVFSPEQSSKFLSTYLDFGVVVMSDVRRHLENEDSVSLDDFLKSLKLEKFLNNISDVVKDQDIHK